MALVGRFCYGRRSLRRPEVVGQRTAGLRDRDCQGRARARLEGVDVTEGGGLIHQGEGHPANLGRWGTRVMPPLDSEAR